MSITDLPEVQSERQPDLCTPCRPFDIWILWPGEQPPDGAGVMLTENGVLVAFRPRRGKKHEDLTAAIH